MSLFADNANAIRITHKTVCWLGAGTHSIIWSSEVLGLIHYSVSGIKDLHGHETCTPSVPIIVSGCCFFFNILVTSCTLRILPTLESKQLVLTQPEIFLFQNFLQNRINLNTNNLILDLLYYS
jgi:hypothetical protein